MSLIAAREKLANVDPDLVRLVERVALTIPVLVVEGYRNEADQTKAFQSGHSKLPWPKSNHNKKPSRAIDLSPYPWTDSPSDLYYFSGFVMGVAALLGLKIRSGADFSQNYRVTDEGFRDLYHYELLASPSEGLQVLPL